MVCRGGAALGLPTVQLSAGAVQTGCVRGLAATRAASCARRSRLVWLMAVVLSPFVSVLEYTTQRLEMDAFIKVGGGALLG